MCDAITDELSFDNTESARAFPLVRHKKLWSEDKGFVKLYILDIRTLPDPKKVPQSMEGLPEKRKERCLRYIQVGDRKRSLGAGIIINQILEEAGGSKELTEVANGKPAAEGVFFNIAHSGNYVVGVGADVPVGCDVEIMKNAPFKVADKRFCRSEKDYITSHSDKDFAFWQLWTLKESYIKMTGEGMQLPLDHFCIVMEEEITVHREGAVQPCYFKHFTYDGHVISVCKSNGCKQNKNF